MMPVDPNDVDGDGIPNAIDVCPNAADPTQHDEDGDRIGDSCDVCPADPDPLQEDTTEIEFLQYADGVGDACDPYPQRGGTKIRAFHTFALDTSTAWKGTGWTIGDDLARATDTASWQHKRTEPGGGVAVVANFASVTWNVEAGSISLVLDGDGINAGSRCMIRQDTDADGSDELVLEDIGVGDPIAIDLGLLEPGMPVQLIVSRTTEANSNRGTADCLARGSLVGRLKQQTDASVSGQYMFNSTDATSDVGSLVVYVAPQPCPNTSGRACPR